MEEGFTAIHMSANEKFDGTQSGFKTEDLAWVYIKQHRCDLCTDRWAACDAEWDVVTDSEFKDLID